MVATRRRADFVYIVVFAENDKLGFLEEVE